MPSNLKARRGRPSKAEMLADLAALRKPDALIMDRLQQKYYSLCMAHDPPLKQIDVREPGINWKALLLSLPKPIGSETLGCGIRKVILAETDCVYEGMYRFHVIRLDGTVKMFEWRDAYDDAYHHFKDRSFKDHVETALRAAVLHQLIEYKEMLAKDSQMELSSHISGAALTWEQAVVQHFPTTLQQLVDAFLIEHQLNLEQVQLAHCPDHVYQLKDEDLMAKWQTYHRQQAHYRIISCDEAMEQPHL